MHQKRTDRVFCLFLTCPSGTARISREFATQEPRNSSSGPTLHMHDGGGAPCAFDTCPNRHTSHMVIAGTRLHWLACKQCGWHAKITFRRFALLPSICTFTRMSCPDASPRSRVVSASHAPVQSAKSSSSPSALGALLAADGAVSYHSQERQVMRAM